MNPLPRISIKKRERDNARHKIIQKQKQRRLEHTRQHQQPQDHTQNPEAACLAANGRLAKRVGRHLHKEVPSKARIICITVINHLNNGNSWPQEARLADPCPLHTQGQQLLHSHVGNVACVRLGGCPATPSSTFSSQETPQPIPTHIQK